MRVPSKLWVGGAACAGRAKALSGTVSSAVPPVSWPAVSSVRFTAPLPVSGSPGTGAVAAGAAIVGGGTANSPASTAATAAARRSRRVGNGPGMVGGPLGLAADAGYRRMVRCAGASVQCLPDLVRLPARHTSSSRGPVGRRAAERSRFASWGGPWSVVVAAVHRRAATCGPYRSTQKRDNPAANASMLRSA